MCGYFCIGFINYMVEGKSLTDFTNLFFLFQNRMVECNSIEYIEHNSIDTSNLNNQQFRLNKISEIEDFFITEIKERELTSKKLSKYISFFLFFINL